MHLGDEDREGVERQRAEMEALSVGPTGSAAVVTGGRPLAFLKLRWSKPMRAVTTLASAQDEIDNYSKWTFFAQDKLSASLDLGWPDVGARAVLYFELERWRQELEIICAVDGLIFLAPEGPLDPTKGLAVQVDTEALVVALDASKKLSEPKRST